MHAGAAHATQRASPAASCCSSTMAETAAALLRFRACCRRRAGVFAATVIWSSAFYWPSSTHRPPHCARFICRHVAHRAPRRHKFFGNTRFCWRTRGIMSFRCVARAALTACGRLAPPIKNYVELHTIDFTFSTFIWFCDFAFFFALAFQSKPAHAQILCLLNT
jgi:hypothetical protein